MPGQFDNRPLGDLVDELGAVKAAIADMEQREADLTDALKASGESAVEGALFRVTIAENVRESLDIAAIRKAMPAAWLAKFTRRSASYTLRVASRNGKLAAAA